jgi:hypothetical protein
MFSISCLLLAAYWFKGKDDAFKRSFIQMSKIFTLEQTTIYEDAENGKTSGWRIPEYEEAENGKTSGWRIPEYEDAENGKTSGWIIPDNTPKGAQIKNIYDSDRGSYVVELKGTKHKNGFLLTLTDGKWWRNSYQHTIEWSMQFYEEFSIFVHVSTFPHVSAPSVARYLHYTSEDFNRPQRGRVIHYGLGRKIADGKWHTIVRDLNTDLQSVEPDLKIECVNFFVVRGSGKVDDIKLHNLDTSYYQTIGRMINRLPIWASAVQIFIKSPIWGSGLGLEYYDDIRDINYRHPHNILLQFLAETGILGLGFFGIFITLVTRKALEDYRLIQRSADKLLYLFFPFSFSFFLLLSLFHFALYENYFLWYFAGMITGFDAEDSGRVQSAI